MFFAQSLLQQISWRDQINMAIKKVLDWLTADMFPNYEDSVKHFV